MYFILVLMSQLIYGQLIIIDYPKYEINLFYMHDSKRPSL